MKKYILFLFFCFFIRALKAQNIGIHAEQAEQFAHYHFSSEEAWNKLWKNLNHPQQKNTFKYTLRKIVFGWQPYWMGTSYKNYNYSLISDIAYFSYEVNPETGSYKDIHYWRTTQLPNYAHAVGKRVHLTATLFENHAQLLENPQAVQTLIDSLVSLVKFREADGINIDFEMLKSDQRDNFTTFIIRLSNALHAYKAWAMLSMALPAIDWSKSYDVGAMQPYVDLFLIMGYEYHWSGSDYAGPVAPKNHGEIWASYDATLSVLNYLKLGIDKEKLALAVPYYGREWEVQTPNIPAKTSAKGKSYTFAQIADSLPNKKLLWDWNAANPYYNRESSNKIYQMWFDNAQSLGYKYDMTNTLDIAGIGIWAMGYDGNNPDLGQEIALKFTLEADTSIQNYCWDLGGAKENYSNNEDYTFRVVHPEAESLSLIFDTFSVEKNFDTLFIYKGEPKKENLVKNYTGTLNIDTLNFKPADFTMHFKSDGRTNAAGWQAHWKLTKSSKPYSLLNLSDWYTKSRVLNFRDMAQQAIVLQAFYLFRNADNRAPKNLSYFYDDFRTQDSLWQNTGKWIFNNQLIYADTAQSSYIHSNFNGEQNSAYLFQFTLSLGKNSLLSFDFLCDSLQNNKPISGLRLRLDAQKDSLSLLSLSASSQRLLSHIVFPFTDSATNFVIVFLPKQDSLLVYKNNESCMQITNIKSFSGGYFGLEAQDSCSLSKFSIYKGRSQQLSLKLGQNGELQNQNIAFNKPAYNLCNMLIDSKYRLSQRQVFYFNIDSTVPQTITSVYDGLDTDIDQFDTPNSISTHWTHSADAESGIKAYWFSLGTAKAKSDIVNWANIGLSDKLSILNLNLSAGKTYYFNLKAENRAGLFSEITSSNGQYLNVYSSVKYKLDTNNLVRIYPNPFRDYIQLNLLFKPQSSYIYKLVDLQGKLLISGTSRQKSIRINLSKIKIAAGINFLQLKYQDRLIRYKLIKVD